MIPNKHTKFIKSLQNKKYRAKANAFVVEGVKICAEVLASGWTVQAVYVSPRAQLHPSLLNRAGQVVHTDERYINAASYFKTNHDCLAVVSMPKAVPCPTTINGWVLALDGVSDPGNLGAIMRIADWYAFDHIVCSPSCVDAFNPKVLAAAMGSFLRVPCSVASSLPTWLGSLKVPAYAAHMQGQPVHQTQFGHKGVLVMGAESAGLSQEVANLPINKITIPRLGQAESLNVAMATAIIADRVKGIAQQTKQP